MVSVRGSIGVKLERGAGICVYVAHALPEHEMAPNDGESRPKTEGRRWAQVSWGPRSGVATALTLHVSCSRRRTHGGVATPDQPQRCGCEVSWA